MYDAKWLNGTQGTVAHNGHLVRLAPHGSPHPATQGKKVPPSPAKRGEVSPGRIWLGCVKPSRSAVRNGCYPAKRCQN